MTDEPTQNVPNTPPTPAAGGTPAAPAVPPGVPPTAGQVPPAAYAAPGAPGTWQGTAAQAEVEPPEGWQAAYVKANKRSNMWMISTIALGITTLLAGMLALGLGAWGLSEAGSSQNSHSRMGGPRGFDDDGDNFRGGGRGNEGYRTNPTPTPSSAAPTVAPTATPRPTTTS